MTVIAYRDGIMAADSLVTSANGNVREGTIMKIRRLLRFNDYHLVGAAGDLSACVKFYRWFEGDQHSVPGENFEAISVNCRTGKFWGWDDGLEPHEFKAPFIATGFGGNLALAAMYAGASAEEAVRAAIKVNPSLGGPVRTMELD